MAGPSTSTGVSIELPFDGGSSLVTKIGILKGNIVNLLSIMITFEDPSNLGFGKENKYGYTYV